MEDSNVIGFLDQLNDKYIKMLQHEITEMRRDMKDVTIRSWREVRETLVENVVKDIYFHDTKPNYVIVTNYSEDDIYVASFINVSSTKYDFIVPANSRIQWVWGRTLDHVYVLGVGDVLVQSYAAEFSPSAVSQTKLVADAGTVGLVGNVKLDATGNTVKIDPDNNGVSINGSLPKSEMEGYGATVTDRPLADAVPIGYVFMSVQTQEVWQSDGTNWVVV